MYMVKKQPTDHGKEQVNSAYFPEEKSLLSFLVFFFVCSFVHKTSNNRFNAKNDGRDTAKTIE